MLVALGYFIIQHVINVLCISRSFTLQRVLIHFTKHKYNGIKNIYLGNIKHGLELLKTKVKAKPMF